MCAAGGAPVTSPPLLGNTGDGFLLNRGAFTRVVAPGSASETVLYGINQRGQSVGGYVDADGAVQGFLLAKGVFTPIQFQGPRRPRPSRSTPAARSWECSARSPTGGRFAHPTAGSCWTEACSPASTFRVPPPPSPSASTIADRSSALPGCRRGDPRIPPGQGRLHHHRGPGRPSNGGPRHQQPRPDRRRLLHQLEPRLPAGEGRLHNDRSPGRDHHPAQRDQQPWPDRGRLRRRRRHDPRFPVGRPDLHHARCPGRLAPHRGLRNRRSRSDRGLPAGKQRGSEHPEPDRRRWAPPSRALTGPRVRLPSARA